MFRTPHRSATLPFQLYVFFFDMVFAYPIYVVLFQQHGLSVLEISLLLMWWNVSGGVLEVPTGALADQYSRRRLLVIAPLIKLTCYVMWCFADGSFYLYAAGFTLWSAGSTLVSGTLEAMMWDTLRSRGRQSQYARFCGRQRLAFHAGSGLAFVAGGILASCGMKWALLASVAPLLAASAVAVSMREPPRGQLSARPHYLAHFRNAWNELKANRTFRYAMIYQLALIGVLGETDEYDPLYYTLVGMPIYTLGLLQVTRVALESLGGLLAHRLKHVAILEAAAPLTAGLMLVLAGCLPCKASIAMIFVAYVVAAPMEVIIETRMQEAMTTASRATVLSGANVLETLVALPLSACFGLAARKSGLGVGYVFFGLILLVFGLWVWLGRRRAVPGGQPGDRP